MYACCGTRSNVEPLANARGANPGTVMTTVTQEMSMRSDMESASTFSHRSLTSLDGPSEMAIAWCVNKSSLFNQGRYNS